MSMDSIKLNSGGGLKLKSSFSAKALAKRITSNRGGAVSMLKSSNYSSSGNALFTKSNPMGRQPRYMTSGQLSNLFNRGRGQNLSYGGPILGSSVSYSQQISGSNSSLSFAQFLGTAAALAPGIMQMFGSGGSGATSQSTASTSVGDNLLNQSNLSNTTISSGSSGVQSLLSSMSTAAGQDSATLRGAIAEANGKLSEMQAQTPEIQAEAQYANSELMPKAEQKLTEAGKGVNDAKTKLSNARTSVQGADAGVKKAKASLEQAMKNKGFTNDEYIEAHSNKIMATQHKNEAVAKHLQTEQAVGKATSDLSNAKTNLSNTPKTKTIDSGGQKIQVPNEPAYSEALRAVEQAEIKLDQAKRAEQAAKREEESAKAAEGKAIAAENKAKESLDEAQTAIVNGENALKKEEEGLAKAQSTFDQAQNNQEKAQNDLEIAQAEEKGVKEYVAKITSTAGKLQTHLKDVQTLQNGINEANNQLQKLEEKEVKEKRSVDNQIDKNNKRNDKLNSKYNFFDDSTSKKEMKAWDKRNANASETLRLSQQSQRLGSNLDQTADYANLSSGQYSGKTKFTISGHTYTADESKGIYLRDGIPTTKYDYENAKLQHEKS